jgi:protein-arginine kinase activator protein McsA
MTDIFDHTVLCKNCEKRMKRAKLIRNGFQMRALVCESCGNKIIHPTDEQEYKNFLGLKNKVFKVKLRLVGNSYAVSIPKEIVEFMREQEKMFNDLVKLTFEDAKKLKLMFD